MSLSFPTLIGQTFPVIKRPMMDSIVASNQSAREVRFANYAYPLYEWEVQFSGLTDQSLGNTASALGAGSFQTLAGFFNQLSGQWGTFTYDDPTDNSAPNQFVATGNASSTVFALTRTIGGFQEPISWITSVSNVTVNGVAQPTTSWSATTPNTLTFHSAPASGAAIAASIGFVFVCRPSDDQLDFLEFYGHIWSLPKFAFRQVRTS